MVRLAGGRGGGAAVTNEQISGYLWGHRSSLDKHLLFPELAVLS